MHTTFFVKENTNYYYQQIIQSGQEKSTVLVKFLPLKTQEKVVTVVLNYDPKSSTIRLSSREGQNDSKGPHFHFLTITKLYVSFFLEIFVLLLFSRPQSSYISYAQPLFTDFRKIKRYPKMPKSPLWLYL